MKKLISYPVALLVSAVSLLAMCIFDILLSLVYALLGKVPFLVDIIEFIGELLDLGLTVLFALFLVTAIWRVGHKLIQKICGPHDFEKSPIRHTTFLLLLLTLAMLIAVGGTFFGAVGERVASYTADMTGLGKWLMWGKAVKDTYTYACAEHLILYKLGSSAFLLGIINVFAEKFVD